MGNKTLIRGTIIGIVALTIFTVVMLVLIGENGWINQEKKNYDKTHVEENMEKQIKKK
ncbi:MAG: hypothetical protein IKD76_03505 [Clostridia bacterium]|nr:hypothetical protein [Clostridia bacterium]